jgi:integrase
MQIPKITLRPARMKSEKSILIYRINYQKESLSRSSGILVNPSMWDKKRQKVKGDNRIAEFTNQEIIQFSRKVEDLMINLAQEGSLSIARIKQQLGKEVEDGSKHNPENLIELYRNEYLRNHSHLSKSSIITYSTTITRLLEYFNLVGTENPYISIHDVNRMSFYNDFITFLKKKGNSNNTADKHIKHVIMLLNYAARKGYLRIYEFRDFKRFSEYAPKIFLNKEEIKKIYELKFERKDLRSARDWLLMGCLTGLRASDLLTIGIDSFDFVKGYISTRNRKTKSNVLIPLHRAVQGIIEERGGELPDKISLTTFNKLVKIVGMKAGINTMVRDLDSESGYSPKYHKISSHCCRRSFATNTYLDGQIEPERLKFLTGHSSVKMLMRYIQIDNLEAAKQLKESWDRRSNLF